MTKHSFKQRISNIYNTACIDLTTIRSIRHCLPVDTTDTLRFQFVLSRVDYCRSAGRVALFRSVFWRNFNRSKSTQSETSSVCLHVCMHFTGSQSIKDSTTHVPHLRLLPYRHWNGRGMSTLRRPSRCVCSFPAAPFLLWNQLVFVPSLSKLSQLVNVLLHTLSKGRQPGTSPPQQQARISCRFC